MPTRPAAVARNPSSRAAPKAIRKAPKATRKAPVKRWSQRVTDTSDALDLQAGLFKSRSAKVIARSLKRSAEESKRKKTSAYQSAMSMLNFYMNRGGKQLSTQRKHTLELAKVELRILFGRSQPARH